jgi:hypothetical protein
MAKILFAAAGAFLLYTAYTRSQGAGLAGMGGRRYGLR